MSISAIEAKDRRPPSEWQGERMWKRERAGIRSTYSSLGNLQRKSSFRHAIIRDALPLLENPKGRDDASRRRVAGVGIACSIVAGVAE